MNLSTSLVLGFLSICTVSAWQAHAANGELKMLDTRVQTLDLKTPDGEQVRFEPGKIWLLVSGDHLYMGSPDFKVEYRISSALLPRSFMLSRAKVWRGNITTERSEACQVERTVQRRNPVTGETEEASEMIPGTRKFRVEKERFAYTDTLTIGKTAQIVAENDGGTQILREVPLGGCNAVR